MLIDTACMFQQKVLKVPCNEFKKCIPADLCVDFFFVQDNSEVLQKQYVWYQWVLLLICIKITHQERQIAPFLLLHGAGFSTSGFSRNTAFHFVPSGIGRELEFEGRMHTRCRLKAPRTVESVSKFRGRVDVVTITTWTLQANWSDLTLRQSTVL